MLHNKAYKIRILIVTMFLAALFVAVEYRLYVLQIRDHEFYVKKAEGIHQRKRTVNPFRGEILDRDNKVFAVSTRKSTVYVYPPRVPDEKKDELSKKLASILLLPEEKIRDKFDKKYHIPIARKISEEKAGRVLALSEDMDLRYGALYTREESKRLYPNGKLLAPVLGFTTIDDTGDNKGIFGLELKYNDWICGDYEKYSTTRTGRRQYLKPIERDILERTYGNRLILTIDHAIQYAAARALRKGVAEWEADSGMAVVQDVKTGAILAMCSVPSFDPNHFATYESDFRRNRCVSDTLEPGSVMKIFTSAILLDLGLVSMDEIIDCEGGRAVIDGRRVTDAGGHKMNEVPFYETFYHSSNIAFSKLGLRIEPPVYYNYLRLFGFGRETGIDVPDESAGILYPLSKWTKFSRTSLPIGYEIGVTPVQVTTALSAIANRGQLMRPYIVERIEDARGNVIRKFEPEFRHNVVSPETAQKALSLMKGAVEEGTGKAAQIEGYSIGGKTGTTRKSDRTEPEYIAGFAGVYPVSDPQICCYVAIDNPKDKYYASTVAVPVFHRIAKDVLSILAIPPDKERINKNVAEATPTPAPVRTEPVERIATAEGEMPDLRGLTMKETLKQMKDIPVDVRFIGSGVVVKQMPRPGAELEGVTNCVITFGRKIARADNEEE